MSKRADITLDIDKGDTLLGGKFKNSPLTVEEFGTDENGQPTVNDKKLLAMRIKKQMPGGGSSSMERVSDVSNSSHEVPAGSAASVFKKADWWDDTKEIGGKAIDFFAQEPISQGGLPTEAGIYAEDEAAKLKKDYTVTAPVEGSFFKQDTKKRLDGSAMEMFGKYASVACNGDSCSIESSGSFPDIAPSDPDFQVPFDDNGEPAAVPVNGMYKGSDMELISKVSGWDMGIADLFKGRNLNRNLLGAIAALGIGTAAANKGTQIRREATDAGAGFSSRKGEEEWGDSLRIRDAIQDKGVTVKEHYDEKLIPRAAAYQGVVDPSSSSDKEQDIIEYEGPYNALSSGTLAHEYGHIERSREPGFDFMEYLRGRPDGLPVLSPVAKTIGTMAIEYDANRRGMRFMEENGVPVSEEEAASAKSGLDTYSGSNMQNIGSSLSNSGAVWGSTALAGALLAALRKGRGMKAPLKTAVKTGTMNIRRNTMDERTKNAVRKAGELTGIVKMLTGKDSSISAIDRISKKAGMGKTILNILKSQAVPLGVGGGVLATLYGINKLQTHNNDRNWGKWENYGCTPELDAVHGLRDAALARGIDTKVVYDAFLKPREQVMEYDEKNTSSRGIKSIVKDLEKAKDLILDDSLNKGQIEVMLLGGMGNHILNKMPDTDIMAGLQPQMGKQSAISVIMNH